LIEWAKEVGYKNISSLKHEARRKLGLNRNPIGYQGEELQPEQPIVFNLPPIKLKTYKPFKRGRGDPETQVLLLGDHHAGEITPSYNGEVYKKRLDELFKSVMTIVQLDRHSYPINDLVIIALGDMVHGENPYQGANAETIEMGAVNQVYELALSTLTSLICSFKQEFKTVKLYGIPGNHGRYSREAPETSNWDIALYKALQKAKLPNGIEIYPPTDFYQMVNIQGFDFFCFHGDQIRTTQGVPYFAQRRKLYAWMDTFHGFPYAVCGHFHEDDYFRVSSSTKLIANGALVSDDPYALKVVGTSTIPMQWTFGVHERIGVTALNSAVVDYNFLPRKTNKGG